MIPQLCHYATCYLVPIDHCNQPASLSDIHTHTYSDSTEVMFDPSLSHARQTGNPFIWQLDQITTHITRWWCVGLNSWGPHTDPKQTSSRRSHWRRSIKSNTRTLLAVCAESPHRAMMGLDVEDCGRSHCFNQCSVVTLGCYILWVQLISLFIVDCSWLKSD